MSAQQSGFALKVAVVYEDFLTQEWGRDVWDRIARFIGSERVDSSWWRIGSLAHPENLTNAADAAIHADILIVSINAAQEAPPPLCAWIDAWLARRPRQSGALVALIGRELGAPASGVEIYLKSVAQQSGLDFLLRKHTPMALPSSSQIADASKEIHSAASILNTVLYPPSEASNGGSIND